MFELFQQIADFLQYAHVASFIYFVIPTLIVSFTWIQVYSQMVSWKYAIERRLQIHVIRIMLMVPLYSICSFLGLRFPAFSFLFRTVRECYESLALYSFYSMISLSLGGDRALSLITARLKPQPHPWPLDSCFPPFQRGSNFVWHTKVGTLQFVLMKPLLVIISLILELFSVFGEGTLDFSKGYIYIAFITSVSQMYSIYCMVLLYLCVHDEITRTRPLYKFFSIKMIIFFTYWQGLVITTLLEFDLINNNSHNDAATVAVKMQEFLIVAEMLFFSLYNIYAFHSSDFNDIITKQNERLELFKQERATQLSHLQSRSLNNLRGQSQVAPMAQITPQISPQNYSPYHNCYDSAPRRFGSIQALRSQKGPGGGAPGDHIGIKMNGADCGDSSTSDMDSNLLPDNFVFSHPAHQPGRLVRGQPHPHQLPEEDIIIPAHILDELKHQTNLKELDVETDTPSILSIPHFYSNSSNVVEGSVIDPQQYNQQRTRQMQLHHQEQLRQQAEQQQLQQQSNQRRRAPPKTFSNLTSKLALHRYNPSNPNNSSNQDHQLSSSDSTSAHPLKFNPSHLPTTDLTITSSSHYEPSQLKPGQYQLHDPLQFVSSNDLDTIASIPIRVSKNITVTPRDVVKSAFVPTVPPTPRAQLDSNSQSTPYQQSLLPTHHTATSHGTSPKAYNNHHSYPQPQPDHSPNHSPQPSQYNQYDQYDHQSHQNSTQNVYSGANNRPSDGKGFKSATKQFVSSIFHKIAPPNSSPQPSSLYHIDSQDRLLHHDAPIHHHSRHSPPAEDQKGLLTSNQHQTDFDEDVTGSDCQPTMFVNQIENSLLQDSTSPYINPTSQRQYQTGYTNYHYPNNKSNNNTNVSTRPDNSFNNTGSSHPSPLPLRDPSSYFPSHIGNSDSDESSPESHQQFQHQRHRPTTFPLQQPESLPQPQQPPSNGPVSADQEQQVDDEFEFMGFNQNDEYDFDAIIEDLLFEANSKERAGKEIHRVNTPTFVPKKFVTSLLKRGSATSTLDASGPTLSDANPLQNPVFELTPSPGDLSRPGSALFPHQAGAPSPSDLQATTNPDTAPTNATTSLSDLALIATATSSTTNPEQTLATFSPSQQNVNGDDGEDLATNQENSLLGLINPFFYLTAAIDMSDIAFDTGNVLQKNDKQQQMAKMLKQTRLGAGSPFPPEILERHRQYLSTVKRQQAEKSSQLIHSQIEPYGPQQPPDPSTVTKRHDLDDIDDDTFPLAPLYSTDYDTESKPESEFDAPHFPAFHTSSSSSSPSPAQDQVHADTTDILLQDAKDLVPEPNQF